MEKHFHLEKPIVIIITGPTGVGKTTLSKIVSKHYGYAYISGDEIKDRLFPNIEDITKYKDKLKKVKEELLRMTEEVFNRGESVVVDYVVLGDTYIEEISKKFKKHLFLRIILPSTQTTIKRDKNRGNWTSGEKSVRQLSERYVELMTLIGKENYIDNTKESPSETFEKHLKPFLG